VLAVRLGTVLIGVQNAGLAVIAGTQHCWTCTDVCREYAAKGVASGWCYCRRGVESKQSRPLFNSLTRRRRVSWACLSC